MQGENDGSHMGSMKVWIDAAGHYQHPEILQFAFDARPHWADETTDRFKVCAEDRKPDAKSGYRSQ